MLSHGRADRYQLSRDEIDAFALRSQQHAAVARDSGRLAKEIVHVTIRGNRKTVGRNASHDKFIRDDTTLGLLAALPAQPGATQMTAGDSTPLSDGAAALILTSPARADDLGVAPLARVVSSAVYGNDSQLMGITPVWALPLALRRAGLTAGQIDVWEIHEAFNAQALAVLRELPNQLDGYHVPDDKLTPTVVPWPSGIRSASPAHVTP